MELYIARNELSMSKSEAAKFMHGANAPCMNWQKYCNDIGLNKSNLIIMLDRKYLYSIITTIKQG